MSKPIRLIDTAGMTEERWLECRRHGADGSIPYTLGGSDIAVVLGISPWRSPYELYMIKKGRMQEPEKTNQHQLAMGHLLEPVVADCYAMMTGNTVINDTWMYQNTDHPYLLCDLDRVVITDADKDASVPLPKGSRGVLECKTCGFSSASHWAGGSHPDYYECQVRAYMATMDLDYADFAALWGNNPDRDFAHPRVLRSIPKENAMFEACDEFIWRLENDKPPEDPADGCPNPAAAFKALGQMYLKSGGRPIETLELPSHLADAAARLEELVAENAAIAKKKKENDNNISIQSLRLAALMEEYEHAVIETKTSRYLIDYVSTSRSSLDQKRLKEEKPELYSEYLKKTTSKSMKVRSESR